jgi:hypothetical protein
MTVRTPGFRRARHGCRFLKTYKTHNVADESKNPDSVLEFSKSVLQPRHSNPALLVGSTRRSMKEMRTCFPTCAWIEIGQWWWP